MLSGALAARIGLEHLCSPHPHQSTRHPSLPPNSLLPVEERHCLQLCQQVTDKNFSSSQLGLNHPAHPYAPNQTKCSRKWFRGNGALARWAMFIFPFALSLVQPLNLQASSMCEDRNELI